MSSKAGEGRPPLQQGVAAEREFERRVILVDQIAVDEMLDMEAGGVGPVVEDLAAVAMTADAPAMRVPFVGHHHVSHAHVIEIAAFERDVVYPRRGGADD